MGNCCNQCGKNLNNLGNKYCSNKCQHDYAYKEYIRQWKLGLVSGNRGVTTKNISQHLRRFLIEVYGEKCSVCHWDKKNPATQRVPLEIDHINGNTEDNNECKLRLVCPNCHSLSPNFRNLNKGKGRSWRNEMYNKVVK